MVRNARPDLNGDAWRRSSYSNQAGASDCVEVADGFQEAVVPVRDSKVPHGPALSFEAVAWTAFIGEVQAGGHRH